MTTLIDLMKSLNEDNAQTVLFSLLEFESFTDSQYQSLMFFFIENAKMIKGIIAKEETLHAKLLSFAKSNAKYPPIIEYFCNLFNKQTHAEGNSLIQVQPKASYYLTKDITAKAINSQLEEILSSHYIDNQPHKVDIPLDSVDHLYEIIIREFNRASNQREYLLNQTIKLFNCFRKNQRNQLSKLFNGYLREINQQLLFECFFQVAEIAECNISFNSTDVPYYDYYHYAAFHKYHLSAKRLYFILIYIYNSNSYVFDDKTLLKIVICFEFTEKMFKEKCPLRIINNKIVINNKSIEDMKEIDIFPTGLREDYDCILGKIRHFYRLPFAQTVLLNDSNLPFLIGMIELYYINKSHIESKLIKYRKTLITLEREIISNYLEQTGSKLNMPLNDDDLLIAELELNYDLRIIYFSLISKIKEGINHLCSIFKCHISFTPFGSVTQLLSGKNADLDIYFKLTTSNATYQSDLLRELVYVIRRIDKRAEVIVPPASRLCLIQFTYLNTKIDLNYFGICSVIGGSLLREYSLYDVRFPILVITLKHLLKKCKMSHSDNASYLNSFSWTLLLVTFLQDIIQPPVLPKTLDKDIRKIFKLPVKGYCTKIEDVPLLLNQQPFALVASVDKLKIKHIKMMRNTMSCAELLIKFMEFIGFYWNYQTVYANTRFNSQRYHNKKDIKRIYRDDKLFVEYFNEVFLRKQTINDTLICDPFDHRYNPAKNVDKSNMKALIEKVREKYSLLIQTGHL